MLVTNELLKSAVDKLQRYGLARNRVVDREIRQVVLTDDEAVAVLQALRGETG